MSYQVIARKWRPQAFEEVTGQEHITRTLRNALEHDRLHHAYLFSGARGVGKTTTARLLAKALNCHKTEKPNLQPCRAGDSDACVSCVEVSESRSIDVLEFDAASHTKVEEIRDVILQGINVSPARDRYKVFIIDEVHMLSTSSFNALLKTLEEPPGNVVFIMATTELHKVPETILSRCQQFEFRTIALQKIFDRLKLIAEAEKIDASDEALREIARSGEGSMRDAQSNFDQVISFSSGRIETPDVIDALGIASSEMLVRTVAAIAEKDRRAVIGIADELNARGHDLRNFCRDLLGLFRDLMICKVAGGELAESSTLTGEELSKQAEHFSESDILRFFNSLAETESKLRTAAQPRFMLEMGLVKLIEMRRVAPIEQLLERLAALESSLTSNPPQSAAPATAPAAAEKKTLISERPAAPAFPRPEPPPEPAFVPDEAPEDFVATPTAPPAADKRPAIAIPEFVDFLPVKLPPIDSEELEHIDDNWLDNAYEEKLLRSGDDLAPIRDAAAMIAAVIGNGHANGNGNGNGKVNGGPAAIPTVDIAAFKAPDFDEGIDQPLPKLSENPTQEELLAYANAHPVAKKVMRMFKAKLVEVKKRQPNAAPQPDGTK